MAGHLQEMHVNVDARSALKRGADRCARCTRDRRPVRRICGRGTHGWISRRRWAAASCTLVYLASWACAGADDPSDEPVRTDSAGVALVANGPEDRTLDWRFERILDLGGTDSGPTAFFRVFPTSIGVDSLRNLYVLDAGNYRVSVFDREGRHVRSFGRQGEGPGELSFPSDLAVAPGGEVAVYDFNRRALVRFDAAGSFAGTFPLPGPLQRKVVLLDNGRIAAAVTQQGGAVDSTDSRLLTLGGDTVEITRVRQDSRFPAQQFSCGSLALPRYFDPRIVWAAAGNRIVVNDNAAWSIRIHDPDRLAAIWRRNVPAIRSTLDLAAWEVAEGDSLRIRRCAVAADEAARKIGYAELAPTVRSLAVAPGGGVWLSRRTEVPGEVRIDVIDATGAYVGTLPGGSPFPSLFRGSDEIITVERDDVNRPHVVVYRVHRGS